MTDVDRDFELTLVDGLRAGDHRAFDEVHRRFNARIFTFLARLSRRRDVAEDLLEETWLRLVTSAGSLRPDTQLGPWLFTVARNLYVSYCRSRVLETTHAADLIGLWPSGLRQSSPFEETAASEMEGRIESALASLPLVYREVLLLVAVEGLQPIEASTICGVTPETLRQRLRRARVMLTQRLESTAAVRVTRISEVTT
jgi:RNA polymerase sigma-70 factor (ECF subfamily)